MIVLSLPYFISILISLCYRQAAMTITFGAVKLITNIFFANRVTKHGITEVLTILAMLDFSKSSPLHRHVNCLPVCIAHVTTHAYMHLCRKGIEA